RKGSGKPSMTWQESVDEALCFGWIDSVRRKVDDDEDAYYNRFTPRKRTSNWSRINVARFEELAKQGRMTEAGRTAFALRSDARTGVYSFEREEAAALTADEEALLQANAAASAYFAAQAPWYRRTATAWIVSA